MKLSLFDFRQRTILIERVSTLETQGQIMTLRGADYCEVNIDRTYKYLFI